MKTFSVALWNKRRWILFKKFISQPSTLEAIARYQREGYMNTGEYPLWAYGSIVDNYLPDGCEQAYSTLLNTPGITDQELADLIEPPVQIISHVNGSLWPAKNPKEAYKHYMHHIGGDEQPDDVDQLFYGDTGLYLRIAPHTNPTELKAFISAFYDKKMWPHLKKQPVWDTKQSRYMDSRSSKIRQSVGSNESIKQRILELKANGEKSPKIAELIYDEFGVMPDESNVRKIISLAKKQS